MLKFNKNELDKFNTYFKQSTKQKLMSFYHKFLKMFGENNTLKISLQEITNIWNTKMKRENRKVVTLKTISNWINKLSNINLISISKNTDIDGNSYILNRDSKNFLQDNLQEKLQENLCVETVENTSITEIETLPKYLNTKIDILDIDSNTTAVDTSKLNFKSYSQKCTFEFAFATMENVFTELKIKSTFIKGLVVDKVEKYYATISKNGCKMYIGKLVGQVQEQCKKNLKEKCLYNSAPVTPSSSWSNNNLESRNYSTEEFNNIVQALTL